MTDFDPGTARRVQLTVSCGDCDDLPKVPDAGTVQVRAGTRVQVMHNGVVVEEGGYFGPWMDEIIRCLHGHHEPQEELVFARVLERLAADSSATPTAIELGAFWAYYSLWFLDSFPEGRVLAMEPDLANLDLGRRNFALNGRSGHFVHGVIGPEPGSTSTFVSEQDGTPFEVVQHDLASLMAEGELSKVDLLLCDIQGAETFFFEQAAPLLAEGAVRFAVVSTHHHSISGDPLTHQALLERLKGMGAHVIAEHSVGESFSGDGLIAVSFDERDRDLTVELSTARQAESLFGALEHDLADRERRVSDAEQRLARIEHDLADRERELEETRGSLRAAQDHLDQLQSTRLFRYAKLPRRVYGGVRGRTRGSA